MFLLNLPNIKYLIFAHLQSQKSFSKGKTCSLASSVAEPAAASSGSLSVALVTRQTND